MSDRHGLPRLLAGSGAALDTTTASDRLMLGVLAAITEFEREITRERTVPGLSST